MTLSPNVARTRWANFVARALRDARARGMTDMDIKAATGIGPSTFHRWQQGKEGGLPQLDKVVDFCMGLDIPPEAALLAMGVTSGRAAPPEPELDPDLKRVGRLLNDPTIPDVDKAYIRRTLQMLASVGGRRGDRAPA